MSLVTVYGRRPVVEALTTEGVQVEQVLLATGLRGDLVREVIDAAAACGVPVKRVSAEKVTRRSGNGRQDQGVVADVVAPGIVELHEWLAGGSAGTVFVLDGVTNASNVGLVIRTAAAFGIAATVLPRLGSPDVGPLVLKASAGVALRAGIVRAPTAADAARTLRAAGFRVHALDAAAAVALGDVELTARDAFVLGNESDGVSPAMREHVDGAVAIPMSGPVESLNVASAAAVVAYEVARRRAR